MSGTYSTIPAWHHCAGQRERYWENSFASKRISTSEAIYEKIEKKYHIPRVGEYEEDVILKGVFKNLLSFLTGKQLLSEGTAENEEPGYRIAVSKNEDAA